MPEPSFESVDFEAVLNRLVLYAQNLSVAFVCRVPGVKFEKTIKGGESPADLAMAALLRFLNPTDTSVAWSPHMGEPTTSKVVSFLSKVLERDFLDLMRSKRYKTTVDMDSAEDSALELTLSQITSRSDKLTA